MLDFVAWVIAVALAFLAIVAIVLGAVLWCLEVIAEAKETVKRRRRTRKASQKKHGL